MEISVTFRHIEPNDDLKKYAEEKISRIKKFFDRGVKAEVVLLVEKRSFIAEVNIFADGIKLNSKETSNENLFTAIDLVVDKLLNQASHYKSKLKNKKGAPEFTTQHNIISLEKGDTPTHKVIRTENYFVKPMTVEEAAMQLDVIKKKFLIFTNAQTHRVNVLYQRDDGNYGLIETESLGE
jgi:putative sigma-54 modulation protein